MSAHPGSFRDPHASVHILDNRVFRVIRPAAQEAFRALKDTAFCRKAEEEGRLIRSRETENPGLADTDPSDLVVEHPALPFISYPYEWPFALLQAAALHHLDLQIEALNAGFVFTDATPYNVQFVGGAPVFIDVTSLRPYRDREPWAAHHQFCEAFLAPLVLQSHLGVPYQAWYRGMLDGVPVPDVANLLRWRHRFVPTLLSHLVLPAAMARKEKAALRQSAQKKADRGLPKTHYLALLSQLRRFIARLSPLGLDDTTWARYSRENTYLPEETQRKLDVVARFCRDRKPPFILDIGCNDGVFSRCALSEGVGLAIGLDADQGALHRAALGARAENLAFLPLCVDLANPSPNQGFAETERASLTQRLGSTGGVLALAVIHHLAIGRNIPLGRAIDFIVSRGRCGLIEFVPKDDPTTQEMLALREDIFPNYTRAAFVEELNKRVEIVTSTPISGTGREIFEFAAR